MSEIDIEIFEAHRPGLERLAYQMLGIRADAEDVVQETFLRWRKVDLESIHSTTAYLRSIVTRLCIDRRREIEKRKESYIGPWLPEPFVEYDADEHNDPVVRAESVSFALMHVLETLSPLERAAYLLRRVFDYDYSEISDVLGKTEANCRQLISRAESHVLEGRARFSPNPDELRRVSDQFLEACATGSIQSLVELLADDVVVYSDGGGKARAALRPIEGVDHAARFFVGIFKKAPKETRIKPASINGQAGFVAYVDEQPIGVWTFDLSEGRIRRCFIIRNPEKLAKIDKGDCLEGQSTGTSRDANPKSSRI